MGSPRSGGRSFLLSHKSYVSEDQVEGNLEVFAQW